ncbi:MAG TPA: hypothetical protein VF223_27225 [Trebonia sp.]
MERIGDVAGYPRSERVGNGYRYYYNDGKLSMVLPLCVRSATRTSRLGCRRTDVTVICTTGVVSGLLDQLPIAQATPIAREYGEQLAEAQPKYRVVSTAPRTFR